MQEIVEWLEKLGMAEYAQRFAEHRIDFSVLPDLTDADLKDLGVVLGDRRKILRAIAGLDATSETAALMPKPPSTLPAVQDSPTAEGSSEQRDVTLYGIAQATEGENPRANYHRLIGCAVKELDRSRIAANKVSEPRPFLDSPLTDSTSTDVVYSPVGSLAARRSAFLFVTSAPLRLRSRGSPLQGRGAP